MKKVVILGAGTAGSSCATAILSGDTYAKVLLIDRDFSRKPVRCAAGVSNAKLKSAGVEVPENLIACKLKRFRVYSPDFNFFEFSSNEPMGYILKRDAFDRWFIKQADDLGADLLEMNVKSLTDLPDYDVLVLADGFPSLARQIGHPQPEPKDIVHCVQKVVKWGSFPRDRVDIHFNRMFALGGYAWVFPKEGNQCRVGLGVRLDLKENPKSFLDFFASYVAYDLNGTELISKMLPLSGPPRTGVYGNILVVGDALPSTDPSFGGGITESIVSGRMAAKAILENRLQNYDKYWKKAIGKQNAYRYRIKRVMDAMSDRDWNEIIGKLGEDKPFKPDTRIVLQKIAKWVFLRKPGLLWKFIRG